MVWARLGRAEPVTVERYPVPASGDVQVRTTMRIMARVVYRSISNPAIVQLATDIVRHVSGYDPCALARMIHEWVRDHVAFLPDALIDGDWIRAPAEMIGQIERYGRARGDCDDVAVLTATLGMAVGIQARFRAVMFFMNETYTHVYTELLAGHDWRPVDPTGNEVLISGHPHVVRSLLLDL